MTAAVVFWAFFSGVASLVSGFAAAVSHDPTLGVSSSTRRFWVRAAAVSFLALFIFGGAASALSDRTADRVGPSSPKTGNSGMKP